MFSGLSLMVTWMCLCIWLLQGFVGGLFGFFLVRACLGFVLILVDLRCSVCVELSLPGDLVFVVS